MIASSGDTAFGCVAQHSSTLGPSGSMSRASVSKSLHTLRVGAREKGGTRRGCSAGARQEAQLVCGTMRARRARGGGLGRAQVRPSHDERPLLGERLRERSGVLRGERADVAPLLHPPRLTREDLGLHAGVVRLVGYGAGAGHVSASVLVCGAGVL